MNATVYNTKKQIIDLEHQLALERLRLDSFQDIKFGISDQQKLYEKEQHLQKEQVKLQIDLYELQIEKAKQQLQLFSSPSKSFDSIKVFQYK